ncbi:unnamed protein product [Trichobilharzia szidati]|nr:unnamed protein product [Trichobilharzia szidati]
MDTFIIYSKILYFLEKKTLLSQLRILTSFIFCFNVLKLSSSESGQSFLLEHIKFLENELERSHENEKRAIRSLQQQYERVKLQKSSKTKKDRKMIEHTNEDYVSLVEYNAVKSSLQTRIKELESVLEAYKSLKSKSTCEVSTNTDLKTFNDKKVDDSYVKALEMQIKQQLETIVAKQDELNRLKQQLTPRSKYPVSRDHYNYTNTELLSALKTNEGDHEMQRGLLNSVDADEGYRATSEVDYWRNIALKMNWEFENLKDDANVLVDILTLLQCQH